MKGHRNRCSEADKWLVFLMPFYHQPPVCAVREHTGKRTCAESRTLHTIVSIGTQGSTKDRISCQSESHRPRGVGYFMICGGVVIKANWLRCLCKIPTGRVGFTKDLERSMIVGQCFNSNSRPQKLCTVTLFGGSSVVKGPDYRVSGITAVHEPPTAAL